MTECNQVSFSFASHFQREVVARFDGGTMTTEAGALVLRKVEQHTGILRQFAGCFTDHRRADRTEHQLRELVRQRVYGLVLGYEDLNDHDQLRQDWLLAMLSGRQDITGENRRRKQDRGKAGAGKSTFNRLELTPADANAKSRYKKIVLDEAAVDRLWVELYLQSQARQPELVVLDLDATDDPVHGEQEGRFFHGYYREYCYLPLYIFAGDHLLCARLRGADRDAAAGSREEVERIVKQLRQTWPEVLIVLRADSGFCRDALMSWCEQNHVDYVFGLAQNQRLRKIIGRQLQEAKQEFAHTGKAARVFTEFSYRTRKSWSRSRRVIAKAEYLAKGENPRFIVTSWGAEQRPARSLYEEFYCQRGEMENRIKEQQLALFADRTSTAYMRSNQIRLNLSSVAYTLFMALRRLGLQGTALAQAQCHTIRLRLLKIGAQIRVTVRRIWISMATGHPGAALFQQVYNNLDALGPPLPA